MPRTCVSAAVPGLPDEPRLSRRSLLTGLPAASAAMMLPSITEAGKAPTNCAMDELLQSAEELSDGLTPYLGRCEYVVVKDAKVQRVLDAVRAMRWQGARLEAEETDPVVNPSDVMLRFAAWKEARRYASRPDLSEEELNLAVDRMTEIEKELDRLPSTSAQDFAAKLAAYTSFGDFDLPGPSHALMREMRRLLDS